MNLWHKFKYTFIDSYRNSCDVATLSKIPQNIPTKTPKIQYHISNNPDAKFILLMDDFQEIIDMVKNDILTINDTCSHSDFTIYETWGVFAAFSAINLLDEVSFDFAVLDLTLGGIIMGENGLVELDGVDVYNKIKSKNPDTKVVFLTGHNLDNVSHEIILLKDKFFKTNNLELKDCYISKLDPERQTKIKKFLCSGL